LAKFLHDKKMLEMQLKYYKYVYVYECERDKGDSNKEVADRTSLQAKNVNTTLMHSLQKQRKDGGILHREIVKKCRDVKVSSNVGAINTGLRSKQIQINKGQFNTHLSLDAVSFV
jgi:hypothetical protein